MPPAGFMAVAKSFSSDLKLKLCKTIGSGETKILFGRNLIL